MTTFIRSFVLITALCNGAIVIAAPEENTKNLVLSDYYEMGMEAYNSDEYLSAVKYLFAYRSANEQELSKRPDFLQKIDEAIAYCEKIITQKLKWQWKPGFRLEANRQISPEEVQAMQIRIQELGEKVQELEDSKNPMKKNLQGENF